MNKPLGMIGVHPEELAPVRALIALLRHPDPTVGELARQALTYVAQTAGQRATAEGDALDTAS